MRRSADADAAEAAMRFHLRGVLDDLPLIVAAQPGLFDAGPNRSGPTASQTRRIS